MSSRVGMICDYLAYVIQNASDGGDLSTAVTASSVRVAYQEDDDTTRVMVFPLNVTTDADQRGTEVMREMVIGVRVHRTMTAGTEAEQIVEQDELLNLCEEIESVVMTSARRYESASSIYVLSSIDSSAAREPMSVDEAESANVFRAQLELTYYQTDTTPVPDVVDLHLETLTIEDLEFLSIEDLEALLI